MSAEPPPLHQSQELSSDDLESVAVGAFFGAESSGQERCSQVPDLAAEEDSLLGTTLQNTYVVSKVLGEGGMGRVYEAQHTRIRSKRYAVKVLHREFSLNPDVRLRFQREAEAAAAIEHDGVVGTYDLGKTPEGRPYMVCEYLAGVDLNAYLKERGVLPAPTVVHIGKQLCRALGAAHQRGVIHRDLKPHNIFVLQTKSKSLPGRGDESRSIELPTVKVLDFGLSRFVEHDNELTKSGMILGTPEYMAPEQANGRETDLRTDVYGIGALLYAAATGRPPFKEETPQQTVLAVMSREPARPRELAPAIPHDLEIVIQKAMAQDPKDRYQNAAEMETALSLLHAAAPSLNRRGRLPVESQGLSSRAHLLLYALGAVFLGSATLLGAVLALLETKGVDYARFRPTVLEWALFGLLIVGLIFPLALLLRRFRRRTWNNSARVADLVPKLRAPLLAAVLAYGVSALIIRMHATVHGLTSGGLSASTSISPLVWYVIVPINALLAASAIVLRDCFRQTKSELVGLVARWGYSAGALMAGGLLLAGALKMPPSNEGPPVRGPAMAVPAEDRLEKRAIPTETPGVSSTAPPKQKPSQAEPAAKKAPQVALGVARERGALALEKLAREYPLDVDVLKALVLAHASRADTLAQSVGAIAKLLAVDPGYKQDSDVLYILKKALLARDAAFALATATLKDHMGKEGAELVYLAMSENPQGSRRLRGVFQELRRAKHVSEELSVAYDLRYARSCSARLPFLDRAEQYGDSRSLHQLQALSTAPKRCGWGRTCYPPCRAEAQRFRQTAQLISRRLGRGDP